MSYPFIDKKSSVLQKRATKLLQLFSISYHALIASKNFVNEEYLNRQFSNFSKFQILKEEKYQDMDKKIIEILKIHPEDLSEKERKIYTKTIYKKELKKLKRLFPGFINFIIIAA